MTADVGPGSLEITVQDPVKVKMCATSFQKPCFLGLPPGTVLSWTSNKTVFGSTPDGPLFIPKVHSWTAVRRGVDLGDKYTAQLHTAWGEK